MKFLSIPVVAIFVCCTPILFAQSGSEPKSRVVVSSTLPPPSDLTGQPKTQSTPVAIPAATPIVVSSAPRTYATPIPSSAPPMQTPVTRQSVPRPPDFSGTNLTHGGMSFAQIKQRLAEAKRTMQTKLQTTAATGALQPNALGGPARVAYFDANTRQIEYYVIPKDLYLKTGLTSSVISTSGEVIFSRTIRGNGVNTPLVITDSRGNTHTALMVQYPVERNGVFIETAYYMSSHPGLVTPEVVNAGRFYIRNTIDVAREALRQKGFKIDAKIADIAERLATVEHVDHFRFRTEPHVNIFNDIHTLYALNEGQTYRYSVSSAGAGGMVQMIPSTYRMVRARFPSANLMPDFVEGMRFHPNAAQAMLLYMQMTWDDLFSRPTIQNAVATGIATEEQIMSAGYNSNPSRIPGYINRGGANWVNLIPRETQIYHQIWSALERNVPMTPRAK